MITYKTIVNACHAFANNHHIIKNSGAGELWQISDHDQNSAFEYPLMYMVDVPSSPGPKSWVYAFRVYFVSRVEAPKDRDGNPIYFEYTSEKSAMLSCAQDFLSYWVQDVNYKLTIEQSLGVTTFIDAQEDGVTGCYVDIRFIVPFTYDSCVIPMDGVPDPDSINVEVYVNDVLRYTLTPGSELLLNIVDTNGDPVSATVSGSNIIVPACAATSINIDINSAPFLTGVSTNQDIDVLNNDQNPVGTKVGDKYYIGDTNATIKNTDGEVLLVATLDAEDSSDFTVGGVTTTINSALLIETPAEQQKDFTITYANGNPVVVTTVTNTKNVFTGTVPNPEFTYDVYFNGSDTGTDVTVDGTDITINFT